MLPFITQPALAPAYQVAGSLLFRGAQYLSRTPVSAGSQKKWTFSCWVRLSAFMEFRFFSAGANSTDSVHLALQNDDTLHVFETKGGTYSYVYSVRTVPVLRDPSAWYHVHCAVDLDLLQVKLHINGVEPAYSSTVAPAAGSSTMAASTATAYVGTNSYASEKYLNGYLTEVAFVDGQALPPTTFGELDTATGSWRPKKLTGITWGPNGFYLGRPWDAASLGTDYSGQGNTWTPTGFAATDVMLDSPSNVYAVLNPLSQGFAATASNGLLSATLGADDGAAATLPIPADGDYVFEVTCTGVNTTSQQSIGVAETASLSGLNFGNVNWGYASYPGYVYVPSGAKYHGGSGNAYGASWTVGDVIGVRRRANGDLEFYKNGVSQGIAYSALGDVFPVIGNNASAQGNCAYAINFGQRTFAYPSAYGSAKALCTANLPKPAIKNPAEGLALTTATGADLMAVLDAATVGWNGQWVEIVKRRDVAEDWRLRFSDDPGNAWATNNANAKGAAPGLVAAGSYVGYRLRVGLKYGVWTAEVAHTTGIATTVIHNLGTARNAVIATRISTGGGDRYFRHPDLAGGTLLKLNSLAAPATDSTLVAFAPDSFQIGASAPSGTYRVLVLAAVNGFRDIGTYTANGQQGSAATFVPVSVRPDVLFVRDALANMPALVLDSVRSPVNPSTRLVYPHDSRAEVVSTNESNGDLVDFVVGGFKPRAIGGGTNGGNGTSRTVHYIAMGRPVGGDGIAPATAR